MEAILLGSRVVRAGVFGLAAAGKLGDRRSTPLARAGSAGEIVLVLGLLIYGTAQPAACGALAVLVGGLGRAVWNLAKGQRAPCRCFGRWSATRLGWRQVARNAYLAVPAGLLLRRGPGPGSTSTAIAWCSIMGLALGVTALTRRGAALRPVDRVAI